jgi:hypothetical protein
MQRKSGRTGGPARHFFTSAVVTGLSSELVLLLTTSETGALRKPRCIRGVELFVSKAVSAARSCLEPGSDGYRLSLNAAPGLPYNQLASFHARLAVIPRSDRGGP